MLVKHEILDLLRNLPILAVVFLPILMSKAITSAMDMTEGGFLLLSVWILFAQVMVGIMLTGPNLIEEREGKTIDALLCSPLTFRQIVAAKGITILLLSMFSQIGVYIVNEGFDITLAALLLPMLVGGILFIEIGTIIGFSISSSKNGSAVSAVIMVGLFLIVSVYPVLPDWTYSIFRFIPSIGMTELINGLMEESRVLPAEALLSAAWLLGLGLWIARIGRRYLFG